MVPNQARYRLNLLAESERGKLNNEIWSQGLFHFEADQKFHTMHTKIGHAFKFLSFHSHCFPHYPQCEQRFTLLCQVREGIVSPKCLYLAHVKKQNKLIDKQKKKSSDITISFLAKQGNAHSSCCHLMAMISQAECFISLDLRFLIRK